MTASRTETTPWAKLAIADLFPARTNPPPDTGAQHAQDWIDQYRLCDQDPAARARLLGSRMGQCVARVYPQAGPEIRELATDLFLWLIAYDDIHVEAPDATPTTLLSQIATFLGVLETGERTAGTAGTASTTGTGFTAALADLAHRTRTVLPPGPAARLTAALHASFLSMLWDTTRRKTPVSLAEYLTMRPHSVLGRVSVTLVEPAAGLDLAATVHDHPDIRRLARALANLTAWTNDLYSFTYEHQHEVTTPLTLPALLAAHHHCSLPDALDLASRMCNDEAGLARHLVGRLTAAERPLRLYATAFEQALAGISGCYGTPRYRT
ncbi:terpene synthase family protein [Streptomyces sp. NRRL S-241]|uniref:terpene synthase family protein n=1 Tax=Streptomyces sp. NRRL S-241 TaxID=1463896 RepID=UPI00068ED900|nr:hypothetical protein [Streptomyces sp. NRRL S-241]